MDSYNIVLQNETYTIVVAQPEEKYSIVVQNIQGSNGASAYEIAVKNGFNGTEEQWLSNITGFSVLDGGLIY
jgi:hypothetical protein